MNNQKPTKEEDAKCDSCLAGFSKEDVLGNCTCGVFMPKKTTKELVTRYTQINFDLYFCKKCPTIEYVCKKCVNLRKELPELLILLEKQIKEEFIDKAWEYVVKASREESASKKELIEFLNLN